MPVGHCVEAARRKVRCHRIPEASVHRQAPLDCVGPQFVEHRGRQVDGCDVVAETGRGQSHVAGAGGDVEDVSRRVGQDPSQRLHPVLVRRRAVLGTLPLRPS
jgi:hypothetical protein